MYGVKATKRVRETKQPRGGYINPKQFAVIHKEDNITLNEKENINASIVGSAVDYLTRFLMGASIDDAFKIALMGAFNVRELCFCKELLEMIHELDDDSIVAACQAAGYDTAYRAGRAAYRPVREINPDTATIENIRIMVNRSITFWEQYGPIVKDGFTFEGAYTHIIGSGDGDYLTKDTLWDFKVSVDHPKSTHTLQLLVYYLMGIHSIHPEFQSVKKIGIFNPRLNNVYLVDIDSIPKEVIQEVSTKVIGY